MVVVGDAQPDIQHASLGESYYPLAAVVRLASWLMSTASGALSLALPAAALLGLLAAATLSRQARARSTREGGPIVGNRVRTRVNDETDRYWPAARLPLRRPSNALD